MQVIEACHEFWSLPLLGLFDSSQLPLPQCILPGEPAEDDRHLKTKEQPKDTEHNDQRRKWECQRFPRDKQTDDGDED